MSIILRHILPDRGGRCREFRCTGKWRNQAPQETPPAPPQPPAADLSPESDGQGPTTGVTFARLLKANQEPQNWLTYGGTYQSLHYSELKQITLENAKDLELKWVFQARWLDPYETTPLVVDGVLYTMQGDDVVALDATTGRLFWIYRWTPASDARLCCGRISRGLAILGDTLYMAGVDAHLLAHRCQNRYPALEYNRCQDDFRLYDDGRSSGD